MLSCRWKRKWKWPTSFPNVWRNAKPVPIMNIRNVSTNAMSWTCKASEPDIHPDPDLDPNLDPNLDPDLDPEANECRGEDGNKNNRMTKNVPPCGNNAENNVSWVPEPRFPFARKALAKKVAKESTPPTSEPKNTKPCVQAPNTPRFPNAQPTCWKHANSGIKPGLTFFYNQNNHNVLRSNLVQVNCMYLVKWL